MNIIKTRGSSISCVALRESSQKSVLGERKDEKLSKINVAVKVYLNA